MFFQFKGRYLAWMFVKEAKPFSYIFTFAIIYFVEEIVINPSMNFSGLWAVTVLTVAVRIAGSGVILHPHGAIYNTHQIMQEFISAIADAFGSYGGRDDDAASGLNAADAGLGIMALKVRKLFIMAGVYSTGANYLQIIRRAKEFGGRIQQASLTVLRLVDKMYT